MIQSPFKKDIFFQYNSLSTIIITADLIIIDANKSILNLLDYKIEDIAGTLLSKLTDGRDFLSDSDNFENLLNSNISNYTVIRQYKHKSGKMLSFEIEVSLITEPLTNNIYISGNFKRLDVSKTGNVFNIDSAKINNLIKDCPFMLYVHDIEHNINMYENINLLNYLGFTTKDLEEKSELEFLDSLLNDEHYNILKTKLDKFKFSKNSREILEVEYLTKNKQNEPIWIFERSVIIKRDKTGKRLYSYGLILDITERKTLEINIKKQRELLKKIILSIPESICIVNVAGEITFTNYKTIDILGYSENKLSKNITKLIHPKQEEEFQNHLKTILNNKDQSTFTIDILLKHKKLGYRWYRSKSIVFDRDETNSPVNMLQLLSDINEVKLKNEHIIDQKKFVEHISSTVPQYLSVYDLKTKSCLYTNFGNKLIFGYTRTEYISHGNRIIHKDQRDLAMQLSSRLINTKKAETKKNESEDSIEFQISHKTEGYIWARLKILITERDKKGYATQALEIIEDITQEKQITNQKNFIEQVAETVPNIIQITDLKKNKVIYSNFEKRTFLDYNKTEWEKTGIEIIDPSQREEHKNRIKSQLLSNPDSTVSNEILIKDFHGQYKWVLVINRVFEIEENLPTQIMSIFSNIDTKKQLQLKLEKQLTKNIELERFASITSHDLKEPLRTLGNYAQILHSEYFEKLDESGQDLLDLITNGTKRMDELINGILDFSKVDFQGKKFEKVNLSKVINAVLEDLEEQINENNAKFKICHLPNTLGDRTQLRQVFQNLISNAIKFTKEKSPIIDINIDSKSDYWEISIKDNGIGIKNTEEKNIFGIFKKLHRQNEYEGQGIGLSICKRIIERHEGEIWFKSEWGKGTTFFFTLPKIKF